MCRDRVGLTQPPALSEHNGWCWGCLAYGAMLPINTMTASRRSKLLALSITAVLTLQYTAPAVCTMRGRMGSDVSMTAHTGESAWETPGSSASCCTLTECGMPNAAPTVYGMGESPGVATHRIEVPVWPSSHPANDPAPLTPPPEA